MPATPAPLVAILGNGKGRFFACCHWCHAQTYPAIERPDDLRILADAKADGWTAERQADGRHRLACRRCTRLRTESA